MDNIIKMSSLVWLFAFPFSQVSYAQTKRVFTWQHDIITYLADNNRMKNHFSFPGMAAYIIICEPGKSLEDSYAGDELRRLPVAGMNDYACFYYLPSNRRFGDTTIANFLSQYINELFENDYIDRNHVYLISNDPSLVLSCETLNRMSAFVAGVCLSYPSEHDGCSDLLIPYTKVSDIWQVSRIRKTSHTYSIPGLHDLEMKETVKARRQELAELVDWSNNILFQFSGGYYTIGEKYRTAFDTKTLVDFASHHTLWQLVAGYHISPRFAFLASGGGILIKEQKQIDDISNNDGQITINGSGSGGAMIRYGGGIRWLPFKKNRLSLQTDLMAGGTRILAGGGRGSVTIGGSRTSKIEKQQQASWFLSFVSGIQYRFGRTVYLATSLQYCYSPLLKPIGSVDAFTGVGINAGIGFTIPVKKKKAND